MAVNRNTYSSIPDSRGLYKTGTDVTFCAIHPSKASIKTEGGRFVVSRTRPLETLEELTERADTFKACCTAISPPRRQISHESVLLVPCPIDEIKSFIELLRVWESPPGSLKVVIRVMMTLNRACKIPASKRYADRSSSSD
jgi:hypothetical protein